MNTGHKDMGFDTRDGSCLSRPIANFWYFCLALQTSSQSVNNLMISLGTTASLYIENVSIHKNPSNYLVTI
jgi:hypothetical protein